MNTEQQRQITGAQEKLSILISNELTRIEHMKAKQKTKDFAKLDKVVVGILSGDGIGPSIMAEALRVFSSLMCKELSEGRLELRMIDGMTIERRAALNESLPADVLEQCKQCDVLVKGPFTTPRADDNLPNLPSANGLLRRELELFAAVRPVKIPEKNIDWCFFRENIEGEYIWGSNGISVGNDLHIDFKVQTTQGSERIARAAFDYARKNGKHNVTSVTKSNIVKLTDGNFTNTIRRIGETEYPEIEVRELLVDATAAKLTDTEFIKGCEVFVLPNLYGDIITDIAAEFQGGLGSAASSNLGNQYALFETIHGSAPYLVEHNRTQYANPCSEIRAMGMMLSHIGYGDYCKKLDKALNICTITERKLVITTDSDGATTQQFTDYLLETLSKL